MTTRTKREKATAGGRTAPDPAATLATARDALETMLGRGGRGSTDEPLHRRLAQLAFRGIAVWRTRHPTYRAAGVVGASISDGECEITVEVEMGAAGSRRTFTAGPGYSAEPGGLPAAAVDPANAKVMTEIAATLAGAEASELMPEAPASAEDYNDLTAALESGMEWLADIEGREDLDWKTASHTATTVLRCIRSTGLQAEILYKNRTPVIGEFDLEPTAVRITAAAGWQRFRPGGPWAPVNGNAGDGGGAAAVLYMPMRGSGDQHRREPWTNAVWRICAGLRELRRGAAPEWEKTVGRWANAPFWRSAAATPATRTDTVRTRFRPS